MPSERGRGLARLRLVNTGPVALDGFRLAFTTVVQLTPHPPVTLVERTSGHHVVAPPPDVVLGPGRTWTFDAACGHRPGHANDGPTGAYVVTADGSVVPVRTGPMGRVVVARSADRPPLRLAATGSAIVEAWVTTADRDRRLHVDDAPVLSTDGVAVEATIDPRLGPEELTIDGWTVAAGSPVALQQAFTVLVERQRAGTGAGPERRGSAFEWRGLHVDLARQFLPSEDVAWLIDVAAWRGLNRLHLHLTDDEAWRVPIAAYPALTDVGAWRGHGRALPPLLGSGPAPYGGSYSASEIAGWVERASAAGIELIPEVDVPGHCAAALAAVPELRDPHDRTGAASVQSFVDNVLNPGVAGTRPFLEAVFGELADLFPSRWLHVGGDEVAEGAWGGSPAAQAYAAERGVDGSPDIGAAFVRDIVELVRATTGRMVGGWQEAAESGALAPEDGYVVGWTSAADCRRLAAAGHAVVASPAQRYYLDMAADPAWDAPGTGWAGHSSPADVASFDVTDGWSPDDRARLLGIQACMWAEHAPDRPSLERLVFPRLDLIAAAAWNIWA